MAISTCSVTKGTITSLGTTVEERGITTEEFKAKFDYEPDGIIDYLNNEMVPKVNTHMADEITQFGIIKREILRLKLNDDAVNLPNAWSDTFGDSSKINAGASSGYTVSEGKLIVANTSYTQQQLTDNAGGTLDTTYTKETQSFQVSTTSPIDKIKIKGETGSTTIVVNVRLETDNSGKPSGTLCGTNTKKDNVTIAANTVYEITLDAQFTPTVSTTYWIVVEYVSGGAGGAIARNSAGGYALGSSSYYTVGAWTNLSGVDLYFGVSQINPVLTATVIWNAVSSEGTMTKAVFEDIRNINSGTIQWYISRDGGTTYTACTLDTLTDISSQPSGTSIVAKLVMTGNAELLSMSYGGLL